MKRAVNVFCLVGMALALVPIAISWVSADYELPGSIGNNVSAIDIVTGEVTSGCPCFRASAIVFIVATALVLVSPFASLLQFGGIGILLIGIPYMMYCGEAYCVWEGLPGIGTLVAGIASGLPLIGMKYPLGVTSEFKIVPLKRKYFTFGYSVE